MSTAMDKKRGKEFGTVKWGYNVRQNDQEESILNTRHLTLLEDDLKLKDTTGEEARDWDRGRRAAYRQWNRAAPGKEQENIRQEQRKAEEYRREPEKVTRIPRRN